MQRAGCPAGHKRVKFGLLIRAGCCKIDKISGLPARGPGTWAGCSVFKN